MAQRFAQIHAAESIPDVSEIQSCRGPFGCAVDIEAQNKRRRGS
jgi:hypothetical protein